MEGEFSRLSQIYGNHIIFLGTDGDSEWENRATRFLKPLYVDQVLKLKFTVSQKEDIDDEFGKIEQRMWAGKVGFQAPRYRE